MKRFIMLILLISTLTGCTNEKQLTYNVTGVVTEIEGDNLYIEGSFMDNDYFGYLIVSEDTKIILNDESAQFEQIKVGDNINALSSGVMTRSLPPKMPVSDIVVN